MQTGVRSYLVMTAGSGGGAFPLPLPIQSVPQALRLAIPIIIATTVIKILLIDDPLPKAKKQKATTREPRLIRLAR